MARRVSALLVLAHFTDAAKPRSVFSRARSPPLDVLRSSSSAKDIRRAETAWRRALGDAHAPAADADVALRALGSISDGARVAALLRRLDRGAPHSSSAAIASLALCGHGGASDPARVLRQENASRTPYSTPPRVEERPSCLVREEAESMISAQV